MNYIYDFSFDICKNYSPIFTENATQFCKDNASQVMMGTLFALGIAGWVGTKAVRSLYGRIYPQDNPSLIASAKMGNIQGVRAWIHGGIDLNYKDQNSGDTALIAAARAGHTQVVRELHSAGADLEMRTMKDHQTALYVACEGSHSSIVKLLLEKGADPNAQDKGGWTPLMVAIINREKSSFNTLLGAREIDLNLPGPLGGTALHHAAAVSDPYFIRTLLEKGANPDVEDSALGHIPLHWASSLENVQHLLASTKDVNKRDKLGQTPFFIAVKGKKGYSMAILEKADPNIPDAEGTYPIHEMIKNWKDFSGVGANLLESEKVDCNVQDASGNTAAHIAVEVGAEEALKILKKRNASFDISNKEGETPLGLALRKGKSYEIFLDALSENSLREMKVQGLSLVDYTVTYGLEDFRRFLTEKGIYFELSEKNSGLLKTEMLKVALKSLQAMQQISPLKITDLSEIISELERVVQGRQLEQKSERLEQLELSIDHYLQRMALQSKHEQQGTRVDRAEMIGWILPVGIFLKELIGPRWNEFLDAVKGHRESIPMIARPLLSREYSLGKAVQYGMEAFQAFMPFKFQEAEKK